MSNTTFKGLRGNFSSIVDGESCNINALVLKVVNGHETPIDWRLKEVNHSPTGLEWGYGGSGPAQLAWCLLREAGLTRPQTQLLYQQFKAEVVSRFNNSGFEITKKDILQWTKNSSAHSKMA